MSPRPAATVGVSVNGEQRTLQGDTTLAELLAQLGHAPESVAVAVNGDFVPRASRASLVLQHGDRVACFQAIVGG
jgi:sulfur carrier protein